MWIIIVALVVLVVLSIVVISIRRNSKPETMSGVEPPPCPEDCRPCPECAQPVKKKATKCLYCGAQLKPDLSRDFGGIALTPDAYDEVADFVNQRNEHDAKRYLADNLGLKDNEARSAIDLYKREHSDLIERPFWRSWVILVFVALVVLLIVLL